MFVAERVLGVPEYHSKKQPKDATGESKWKDRRLEGLEGESTLISVVP